MLNWRTKRFFGYNFELCRLRNFGGMFENRDYKHNIICAYVSSFVSQKNCKSKISLEEILENELELQFQSIFRENWLVYVLFWILFRSTSGNMLSDSTVNLRILVVFYYMTFNIFLFFKGLNSENFPSW